MTREPLVNAPESVGQAPTSVERFVYFDLGNVLVTFDHQIAVNQLARLSGRPASLVRHVVFDSNLQNQYETGLMTSDQYAAAINLGLESDLPTDEILESISAIFEPNHAILEVLRSVRSAGIPMGILSNTCEAHWRWIVARQWPMLDDWFRVVVLSYEAGSMKPAPPIYEVCERQAGCAGNSIFFTDDRIENVLAAERHGWQTHRFEKPRALLEALELWLHLQLDGLP